LGIMETKPGSVTGMRGSDSSTGAGTVGRSACCQIEKSGTHPNVPPSPTPGGNPSQPAAFPPAENGAHVVCNQAASTLTSCRTTAKTYGPHAPVCWNCHSIRNN